MKDIIISAKNGDSEAFGKLYELCRKQGFSVAKQFVKNDTDAEDMYQDAFLKAMENIDRFDENRDFGPWLNTIIANTCKDFLKKNRPMNFTDMSDDENEFVDTIASSDESSLPESMYVRREMLKIVDGIVEMLPNDQREATLLFYFKDFSVKQVAEYQHASEDTVKSRLNYSRKKVEQATKDYEKKNGIKICVSSVIPAIIVLYFKNSVYAAHLDETLTALSAGGGLGAAATSAAKVGTGAFKVGTAAGKVAAWKISAIVAACIIAAIGVGLAILHFVTSDDLDANVAEVSEKTSEEPENQIENDIQEADTQEEPVAEEEEVAEEEITSAGYINDEGYYVFGSYEQDGNEANGPEPIEWEILDENENGTLLISRYVLDGVPYSPFDEEVTWETSSLRSWMNNDFYNAAFDDEQKRKINTVTIVNEDNQCNFLPGGNNTSDKIFALSVSEILKYYDFNTYYPENSPTSYLDYWVYERGGFGYSEQLIIPKTEFACAEGITITEEAYNIVIYQGYEGELTLSNQGYSASCIGKTGTCWWLRSPGAGGNYACIVDNMGRAGAAVSAIGHHPQGVRPALYVNM